MGNRFLYKKHIEHGLYLCLDKEKYSITAEYVDQCLTKTFEFKCDYNSYYAQVFSKGKKNQEWITITEPEYLVWKIIHF